MLRINRFNLYNLIHNRQKRYQNLELRQLSSVKNDIQSVDIQVPTSWGHLSGKQWGNNDHRPILALPGWRDNIGTLIPLIEKLSKHINVIAIDWAGTGHSSRYPKGFYYNIHALSLDVRAIVRYFNWPKVSILGHSLGAGLGFLYSAMYPNDVDFLISLETLCPIPIKTNDYLKVKGLSQDAIIDIDMFNKEIYPVEPMTYDEARKYIVDITKESIPFEMAHYLLDRETTPLADTPEKIQITTDIKHCVRYPTFPDFYIRKMAETVLSPILHIKAKNYRYTETEKLFQEVSEILQQRKIAFSSIKVEGSHHVHLTNPERVLPFVLEFIEKYDQEKRFKNIK